MVSESWVSLASRPSPKQQLQGAGIIDFEGINSQLQIVQFQGIICKLSCSHTPAGTGGLVQNSLKRFGQQFQSHLWVNKSPSWEESQISEHLAPGRSPFTGNFFQDGRKVISELRSRFLAQKWAVRFAAGTHWFLHSPQCCLGQLRKGRQVNSVCRHQTLPSNAHPVN